MSRKANAMVKYLKAIISAVVALFQRQNDREYDGKKV